MFTTRHRRGLLLATLALVIAPATADSTTGTTAAAGRNEAVTRFAQRYEDAVNLRHVAAINRCVDEKALIGRALEGVSIPDVSPQGMAAELSASFDWGRSVADGMGETGHYRLLGVRESDGTPRALFRLVNGDGALNYHDTELVVRSDGTVQIVDALIYITGETLSGTMNRMLMGAARAYSRGETPMTPTIEALDTMTGLLQQGRFGEVLTAYDALSGSARTDKTIMVLRITAAAQVGAEATEAACSEFRAAHPNDPCVDLVTLDQLLYAQRWAEAEAAVARIGQAVGADAYLDDLAATICMQDGRLAESRTFANKALSHEPSLEAAHWTILSLDLLENRHDAVATGLSRLENEYGYEFADLTTVNEYAAFVKSDAFATWLASHDQTAGGTLTHVVEP